MRASLETYQQKRNFRKTSEPAGKKAKTAGERIFVIQRHEASHLHYDFRLELDGVLKSWAVPKEPLMDPTVKRLAVQVEDHPLEYASFSGDIPKGQYGGGHVDIWDDGTWIPLNADPRKAYDDGRLTFELRGGRLKGRWTLIRTQGKNSWLLLKNQEESGDRLVRSNKKAKPRKQPGRKTASKKMVDSPKLYALELFERNYLKNLPIAFPCRTIGTANLLF